MAHAFLNLETSVEVIQRCTKVPWETRKLARQIANNSRKPDGVVERGYGSLSAYKCDICHAWHTGHK